jgi:ribosomal protein S18 acetylase RimI-like enzyme
VNIEIREYMPEDEQQWMRLHAIIMSISHSWNYSIQIRPMYEGYQSTKLVAVADGKLVGLTDVQYENEIGEICFLRDCLGGYVLEFGRLPEYSGHNLGKRLIDAAVEDASKKGFHRLEYWSQDRNAQRFYQRIKMKEIGRHYRFRMKPPQALDEQFKQQCIGIEYLYCACLPEEWPEIQKQFEVLQKHPLEPHLCIGYEIRF